MVTVDDVAAAVLARCTATSAVGTAIPGGVWFPEGPDVPASYPYAVVKIEAASDRKLTAGKLYTQAFTAKVTAYVPVGASGCDTQAVSQALFAALATVAASAAFRALSLRDADEKFLHSVPLAPSGENDPARREAREVYAAGLSVEILVQGDRTAA